MKLGEAMSIIEKHQNVGFIVSFSRLVFGGVVTDNFPDVDDGEEPFKTIEEALLYAQEFARAVVGRYFDIRILTSDHRPTNTMVLLAGEPDSG